MRLFLQVTHTPGPSAQPSFDRTMLPGISTITSQVRLPATAHVSLPELLAGE